MRRIASISCAIIMALTIGTALAADLTGKWTGSMAGPDGGEGFALAFNFKQDGAKLTGNVEGPQGEPMAISEGKVEGDKISFVVTADFGGNTMKIIHEGTVSGDEIKMTSRMADGQFPGGQFTLKRAK